MPGELTEITELGTALGIMGADPDTVCGTPTPPSGLHNVDAPTWERLCTLWRDGRHRAAFVAAHANGRAFATASDGLRHRPPRIVEWRGPHRTPGDDTVPADLRIDHVYLISCKYLSKVLFNAGPPRLFDRLLVGDERSRDNWFLLTAPTEFEDFYRSAVAATGSAHMPASVADLDAAQRAQLRSALSSRTLPAELVPGWEALCARVSDVSAKRWSATMDSHRQQLRMLWRLLRISSVTYFVLGTQPASGRRAPASLRLRVDAAWDWSRQFDLVDLQVAAQPAGQPQVGWVATISRKADGTACEVRGHVEVRWSHGRFGGSPEAKVYLDTPHAEVPGYHPLT